MAFCNTYRFFIVGSFLALSPIAFADGVCNLVQLSDGSYTITCSGDGIQYQYETQTQIVVQVQNCDELKADIIGQIDGISYYAKQNYYNYYQNISHEITQLENSGVEVVQLEDNFDGFAHSYSSTIDSLDMLSGYVDENMICGSCSTNSSGGSSGGSCCDIDLNPILDALNYGHEQTISLLSIASNVVLQLEYTNFLLEHGFHDVTNQLDNISFTLLSNLNSITNQLGYIAQLLYKPGTFSGTARYYWQSNLNSSRQLSSLFTTRTFYSAPGNNYLRAISQNITGFVEPILSLDNYWYDYSVNRFPILTNTVGTLTVVSTNFFTFFRGEIGVKGVLGDWTANDGTYYDFLTNHYLKVVNGELIQGSAASKTNWFSRIETLLAALVFADSESTNTVNTSSGTTEQSQLSAGYSTINASASTSSQGFRRNAESIVSLYRRFGAAFDGAALPSHVLLIRATSSDDRVVEIGFDVSSGISVFVEACRLVCTFCWASVGIFLLYRFMVWATNCVVRACMFVYQIVSRLFK